MSLSAPLSTVGVIVARPRGGGAGAGDSFVAADGDSAQDALDPAGRHACVTTIRKEPRLTMASSFFDQPILNSPYEPPTRHHALDADGQPLDIPPVSGRRRSELITPVPKPRKKQRKAGQAEFVLREAQELSTAAQEYDVNGFINEIRGHVETWRAIPNPSDWGVTPATQRLLIHWRHHQFQSLTPFFCQIEAVETAIWLAEVARRERRYDRLRAHLRSANEGSNPELSRIALKMATGSGKTTVMAMLIAWQTVNAVRPPGSNLYRRGFLVVAPGITIKDRLRVLQPVANDLLGFKGIVVLN